MTLGLLDMQLLAVMRRMTSILPRVKPALPCWSGGGHFYSKPMSSTVKPFYYQDIFEAEKPLDTPFRKITCKMICRCYIVDSVSSCYMLPLY